MQFIQFTAARADTGAVLPYATATVYLAGTLTKAALFDPGGTAITNPVTADVNGLVGFAAANGAYDAAVVSSDGSYTTPGIKDLQLYDLTQLDSQVAAAVSAGSTASNAANIVSAYTLKKVLQRIRVLEEMSRPYLPALTTSGATYYGVYSTERLVSSYSGALARVINPTGGATVDLGSGETSIGTFEIENLRVSAVNVKVDKWYDQGGSARDLTQPTAASRPSFHESGTINGKLAMTFPDVESSVGRFSHFVSPTISVDRQNFTMFLVIDPTASYKNQIYFRLETSVPATNITMFNLSSGSAVDNGRLAINVGTIQQTHKYIQATAHVLVIRGTSGVLDVWLDDVHVPLTNTASTSAKFYLGSDPTNTATANFRCGACILNDKGLNDADVAAVSAVLRERFRLSTDYDATIVYSGTSRTVSGQADNAFSKIFYEQKYFARNYRVINLGQDGQALSTTLTNFAAREATAYDATKPWIYVIDDPINDLGGLGSSSNPSTIYNTTIAGLITAAKALGSNVHVIVRTCLPQDSTSVYSRTSAAIEADRQTLNTLILANTAGAGLVIDTAALPTMGTYPTNPDDATKYVDRLHLTALGNSLLAPANAAPIEGLSL
jgi:hypothetical protein